MIYPKYYLDGNIALQEAYERYHRQTIDIAVKWMAATVGMFLLLIFGITFEMPLLVAFAALELLIALS